MNFKNWLHQTDSMGFYTQPFQRATDMPLFRGVKVPFTSFFIRAKIETVNKDRKPRDSTRHSHELADKWFYEKFKLKPRSQGVFCTGSSGMASDYGTLAYVLPVNNFSYMWALNHDREPVRDSLVYMNDIKRATGLAPRAMADQITDSVLSKYDFVINKDIEDAQHIGAEIILFCDEVFLVPVKYAPSYATLLKELRK